MFSKIKKNIMTGSVVIATTAMAACCHQAFHIPLRMILASAAALSRVLSMWREGVK